MTPRTGDTTIFLRHIGGTTKYPREVEGLAAAGGKASEGPASTLPKVIPDRLGESGPVGMRHLAQRPSP
jgi:hypothetical protein